MALAGKGFAMMKEITVEIEIKAGQVWRTKGSSEARICWVYVAAVSALDSVVLVLGDTTKANWDVDDFLVHFELDKDWRSD